MTRNRTSTGRYTWPLFALLALCVVPTPVRAVVILAVDVNDTTDPALTETGFQPFVRTTNPATYGGQTLTISGVGFVLADQDRVRPTPTDSGTFTDGELLRDFIFGANGAANTTGLNARVQGLVPFGVYKGSVWSFDTSSNGTRVADWAANNIVFRENYTFDGNAEPPAPVSNDVYRMDFTFIASESGEVLIKGRRDALSMSAATPPVADIGVFLNALRLDHQSTLAVNPTPVLSVDFGNGDVQPGFSAMALPAAPQPSYSQAFGSQTVTLNGVGVNMDQRNRATPVDAAPFDQGALLRDFVFAGAGAPDITGLDVNVDGLIPNQQYLVSLWSYDSGSPGLRVADWLSNGVLVNENARFDTVLPATNDDYRFSFVTTADALGKLVISGRVDALTLSPNAPNVFLNALQIRAIVPEPSSLAMAAVAGLTGLALAFKRRGKRA
jgi:hypothetical protein